MTRTMFLAACIVTAAAIAGCVDGADEEIAPITNGGTTAAAGQAGETSAAGRGGDMAVAGGHAGDHPVGSGETGGAAGAVGGAAGTSSGGSSGGATAGLAGAAGTSAGSAGFAGQGPPQPTFCGLASAAPASLTVPAGFCAHAFVGDTLTSVTLREPRVIRFASNGDVFVTSPYSGAPGGNVAGQGIGAIVVLPDDDHDGVADAAVTYAGGPSKSTFYTCNMVEPEDDDLTCVHGLAFGSDYLYFTRRNEVRRYPYAKGDRVAPDGPGELVATLGIPDADATYRWTHTLETRADGTILVTRGQVEQACGDADAELRGAVLAIDVTTLPASPVTLADGFRNPLFARCRSDGACFANELSDDTWDVGGREKLALLTAGSHWGYPCCYTKDAPVGAVGTDCGTAQAETLSMPLHSTPFGLDFEPGRWPGSHAHSLFIAMHGSAGSWVGTGILEVPVDTSGAPTGTSSYFATGWGSDPDSPVEGRATDLAFAPDGRLFVIDDNSGDVWWIAPEDLPLPAGW